MPCAPTDSKSSCSSYIFDLLEKPLEDERLDTLVDQFMNNENPTPLPEFTNEEMDNFQGQRVSDQRPAKSRGMPGSTQARKCWKGCLISMRTNRWKLALTRFI